MIYVYIYFKTGSFVASVGLEISFMGLENHSWSGFIKGNILYFEWSTFVALNSENVEKFPGWAVLYDLMEQKQ